ncbi:MAG: MFS transporter [Planctomycetaceae bacterium]
MNGNRPTNVRWMVFVLGFGTSWLLYLHRYSFALIKPFLKEELGVSNTELGAMDTLFAVTYAGVQFPIGLWGDVAGVHWLLGGLILLWSVSLALHAWAPTQPILYGARALLGAAQAGVFSLVGRLTRSWFPQRVRTTVQGWIGVSAGRLGGLSANLLLMTVMIGILGVKWQLALYILAGVGITHGVAFLTLFRNSPSEHPWSNSEEVELVAGDAGLEPEKPLKISELVSQMDGRSIRNLVAVNAASTFSSIADHIYSHWIPLFLVVEYQLKYKEMGIYSALPLLGGAAGGIVGGILSDRLIRWTGSRRWVRSLVGFSGKLLAAITLAVSVVFFFDDPYVFCGMLFVVKLFADISLTSRWGTITDIGGRATASVFAFNNSVASFIVMGIPAVYGYISDVHGWRVVFWVACGAYVACALTWLLVNCTIPVLANDRAEMVLPDRDRESGPG